MNILDATDLHFTKSWFKWIDKQQNEYDVFAISGDFLDSSKDTPIVEQIAWISTWIKAFKKLLFVCSGNHDIEELEHEDWLKKIDTDNYILIIVKKL